MNSPHLAGRGEGDTLRAAQHRILWRVKAMKRIFLFVLTNIAVLVVINITLRLLGVDRVLDQSGAINFSALMVMSAVIGFSGSIISLLMSKWMAKQSVRKSSIIRKTRPSAGWWKPCNARRKPQASACRKWQSTMRRM
jgi:Zn-dependent protease with chaperone function